MGTLASHAVVFRGVVLTFSLQTTAWEATGTRDIVKEKKYMDTGYGRKK